MLSAGFKPAILAINGLQRYEWDHKAAEIGHESALQCFKCFAVLIYPQAYTKLNILFLFILFYFYFILF